MLWLPGGRAPSAQKTGSREGIPGPATNPQVSGRSPLAGFTSGRPGTCWFAFGGRPREEVLPYEIKEVQESACTVYTAAATATTKEWDSE